MDFIFVADPDHAAAAGERHGEITGVTLLIGADEDVLVDAGGLGEAEVGVDEEFLGRAVEDWFIGVVEIDLERAGNGGGPDADNSAGALYVAE